MYNPYLPQPPDPSPEESPPPSKGLSALLKSLKLDEIDAGDVLILVILLLLFLDDKEDNLELLITLGLMLLL